MQDNSRRLRTQCKKTPEMLFVPIAQEKFQIPKLGNSCKFSQFRDNIGEKLGTKLPKLGKFWEVEPLLRSQKRDFFGTI